MNVVSIIVLLLLFASATYMRFKNKDSVSNKMAWLAVFFLLIGYVADMWIIGFIALYFAIYSLVIWAKGD